MAEARNDSFDVHITRPSLERLTLAELEEAQRGVVFVSAPKPPRVGTRIQLDIIVAGGRKLRQQGLVIWSRPAARPGLTAGFRAQLENAHPTLLKDLQELVAPIREGFAHRPASPGVRALDAPVHERHRPISGTRPSLPLDVDVHFELDPPAPSPRSRLRTKHLFQRRNVLALPPPLLMLPPPPMGEHTRRIRRRKAAEDPSG